jgi:hypothetical protein
LIATTLFFLTAGLSIGAFAKSKSTEVQIYQASQVTGTTLQPGTYHVSVNPTGSTAVVTFKQDGKPAVTATGQVVQLTRPSHNTSVTTNTSGSVPTIDEIDFEGSPTAVSFSATTSASTAGE